MSSSGYQDSGYFGRVQSQLRLNVLSQVEGVLRNTAQNASQGVSPSVNAVDTGIQAAMALSGLMTSGLEAAFIPALQALGLSGMACLPISKQLDPVLGIDCHIMFPGGPLPNPYIGLSSPPTSGYARRGRSSRRRGRHSQAPQPGAYGSHYGYRHARSYGEDW